MNYGLIGLFLAMLLWAGSFSIMKILVGELGPLLSVFLRLSIACAILFLFVRRVRMPIGNKADYGLIALLALCEPCLYFLFESYALIYTTASEASIVMALQPIAVIVGAALLLNETLKLSSFLGSVIALVGVILISVNGADLTSLSDHLWGNFLEFCAVICATIYSLTARVLLQNYSAWFITGVQSLVGAVFFGVLLGIVPQPPPVFTWMNVTLVAGLAIAINIFATFLYNFSYRHMAASQVAMWLNILPILSVLFAWLILGEALTGIQYLGCTLVVCGVLVAQYQSFFIRKKSVV